MVTTRSFNKDDSGSNILIEYIFTIIIAAILFSVLLLNLQSILARSDQIIMGEEIDIAASIIGNQVSDYSNEINLNNYQGSYSEAFTQDSARYFDIPKPYSGRQYSVHIVDAVDATTGIHRGKITVTYESDPNVYSVFYVNTPVQVEEKTIICNTYKLKLSLNQATQLVKLEEVP